MTHEHMDQQKQLFHSTTTLDLHGFENDNSTIFLQYNGVMAVAR